MFTGIVQAKGQIAQIIEKEDFRTHVVKFSEEMLPQLALGASVANNGCCLTVTKVEGDLVSFDLMVETLRLTNLGELNVGDWVNLERAAKYGDEIGGHVVSGHVMCVASIDEIVRSDNNCQIWFKMPDIALMKYVLYKGFIAIDGISLTVGEVKEDRFCVHLIPETLARTTLGDKGLKASINIEIDPQTQAVVDTVERVMTAREAR